MPGISTLGGSIGDSIRWNASNNILAQNPISQGDSISTSFEFSTDAANNAVGGADELVSFLQSIAPGGSATVDLKSITNILQQAGVALSRIKGYKVRLLAASGRGAVDSTNGTACSSITVGNAGSNPNTLELGGTNPTFTINSGGSHQHFDPSAAGFAAVTHTAKNVLITNNDGLVAAAVQVTLIGGTT